MTGVTVGAVRGWRGLALLIVVVVAIAGIVLVAGTADKGGSSAPTPADAFEARGAVTDAGVNPWAANDPALLARVESTAGVAAGNGPRAIEWTQTGIGAVVTQDDGSMLAVASVENSVDGPGAVVSEITLSDDGGTQSARRYMANGVFVGDEEFTLGAANADGTIPFTGTGKCVKGGTRAHKNEQCTYAVSGTLDPTTNVVVFEVTGTSTR